MEKDIKLSDLVKNDNDKIELLWFLNNKRMDDKKFTEELITQLSEIFLLVYQKKCIEEKNYEIGDLIYVMSSTYYYENKERKKIYIIDIIKDKECFKNEEFIVNMICSLIKDELKYANSKMTIYNVINSHITSYLQKLFIFGFDKKSAMNVLENVLKLIGLDDKNHKISEEDKNLIQICKNYVDCFYRDDDKKVHQENNN